MATINKTNVVALPTERVGSRPERQPREFSQSGQQSKNEDAVVSEIGTTQGRISESEAFSLARAIAGRVVRDPFGANEAQAASLDKDTVQVLLSDNQEGVKGAGETAV